jgi:hypothetical protein
MDRLMGDFHIPTGYPPHRVGVVRHSLLAFGLRAWEACLAALLLFIGLADLLGASPVPPELAPIAPEVIFHLYGLYLSVGSALVLAAIFGRFRPWSRRVERTGMLLLAGATGSLVIIVAEWFRVGVRTDDGKSETIAFYLIILLVLTTIGSVGRWFALRHPPTIEVRGGGEVGQE